LENTEENCEKILKIWKKPKLNSKMKWTKWKKGMSNSEKIGKIQKKRAYIHPHHHHQDKQLGKINLK
jgi:L-amino acid N-acyltransferase YncA